MAAKQKYAEHHGNMPLTTLLIGALLRGLRGRFNRIAISAG
jgi:hypothetical protein